MAQGITQGRVTLDIYEAPLARDPAKVASLLREAADAIETGSVSGFLFATREHFTNWPTLIQDRLAGYKWEPRRMWWWR